MVAGGARRIGVSPIGLPVPSVAVPNTTLGGDRIIFRARIGIFTDPFAPVYSLSTSGWSITITNEYYPNPPRRPQPVCTAITATIADGPNYVWDIECTVSAGAGGKGTITLNSNLGQCVPSEPADLVSFPLPIVVERSLRPFAEISNRTLVWGKFNSKTAFGDSISFDVQNLPPNPLDQFSFELIRVFYGPDEDPRRYPCDLFYDRCTTETLTCRTVAGGTGEDHKLSVVVWLISWGDQRTTRTRIPNRPSFVTSVAVQSRKGCSPACAQLEAV